VQAGVNGNGAGPQPTGDMRAFLASRACRLLWAILLLTAATFAIWLTFSAMGSGSGDTGTGNIAPKTSTPWVASTATWVEPGSSRARALLKARPTGGGEEGENPGVSDYITIRA
jgi:hypothetical protein